MESTELGLVPLTDQYVLDNSIGEIITNHSFSFNKKVLPLRGGLHCPEIFGQVGVCDCINNPTKTPGTKCPRCNVLVVDATSTRFGHYTCFYPYIQGSNGPALSRMLEEDGIIVGTVPKKIAAVLAGIEFSATEIEGWKKGERSGFWYRAIEEDSIKANIGALFLKSIAGYSDLLSTQMMVSSSQSRMYSVYEETGKVNVHPTTTKYSRVIEVDKEIIRNRAFEGFSVQDFCQLVVIFQGLVDDLFLNSSFLDTSKQNTVRNALLGNFSRSGRAVIVPADVPLDTVLIPMGMAWIALKDVLVEWMDDNIIGEKSGIELYNDPPLVVLKRCEEYVETVIAVVGRQPTLHKLGLLAMKVKVNPDYTAATLGFHPLLVDILAGDFDGDQMYATFAIDPSDQAMLMEAMGVENNLVFSNGRLTFPLSDSSAAGFGYITDRSGEPSKDFPEGTRLTDLVKKGTLNDWDLVSVGGAIKTAGMEYLEQETDNMFSFQNYQNLESTALATKYMLYLNSFPDAVERISRVTKYLMDVSTRYGSSCPDIFDFMGLAKNDGRTRIVSTPAPAARHNLIKEVKETVMKTAPSLAHELMIQGKLSWETLSGVLRGMVVVDQEGRTLIQSDSWALGVTDRTLYAAAGMTRDLFQLKAQIIGSGSGFLTRQLVDLALIFCYDPDQSDEDLRVITVPKRAVRNRRGPSGDLQVEESDDPVEMYSIVNADSFVYNPFNSPIRGKGVPSRADIGIDYITRLSSPLTQSALNLKRGGSTQVLEGFTPSVEDGIVTSIDDEYVTVRGEHNYRYKLLPGRLQKCVDQYDQVKKGDPIVASTREYRATARVANLAEMLGAKAMVGDGFGVPQKNYAFETCTISFDGETMKFGSNVLEIGESVPMYPEGYVLEAKQWAPRKTTSAFPAPWKYGADGLYVLYEELRTILNEPTMDMFAVELLFNALSRYNWDLTKAIESAGPIATAYHKKIKVANLLNGVLEGSASRDKFLKMMGLKKIVVEDFE